MKIKKSYSRPILECEFKDNENMLQSYKVCKLNNDFNDFVRKFYGEIVDRSFISEVIWSDNEFGMTHKKLGNDLYLFFPLCRTFIFRKFFR